MASAPVTQAPSHLRPAFYRRNLFLLVIDFLAFAVGLALMNGQTILADFVGRLSESEVLVGIIGVLFSVGVMVPQLAVAPAVARSTRKRLWVVIPGIPGRSMMFVIAVSIVLLGVENPVPILVIIFLGIGAFAICDGMSAVGWLDILGTVLPNDRRGRVFGIARTASSLIILLIVSDLVGYVLDARTGPAYPYDYALLFILAGVCYQISLIAFVFIKEPPRSQPVTESPTTRRDYMAFLRHTLRHDTRYRDYLAARLLTEVGLIAGPFYIRFATESLGIPSAEAVSRAIQVSTLGSLLAAMALGWLSERRGSRLVILIGVVTVIAQPVAALLAGVGSAWLIYAAFAASGVYWATHEAGMLNWIIEYADDSRRAIYFSLTSTFNIVAVASPVLGGIIAERLSYEALFVVALGISLAALVLSLRLIEPRTLQNLEPAVQSAD
ncbi:MAG: MFS transporter [Anaerolineae bacterium]